MRWLWLALALVVLAGAAALWWPSAAAPAMGNESASTASPASSDEPKVAAPTVKAAPQPANTAPPSASTRPHSEASTSAVATPGPCVPEHLPDGSLRLDARFSLTGSGSEQDPLVITWPLLASASESIDAAAGRLTPPPCIGFLDGQWIQISAFLAPPLWGERTTELLVMKNRWDGCCIGLPPTPFDCIEATLATPIALGAKHSISYGTMRGRLVVQPFTAGSFLLGLYRLEQAQIVDMRGP
jgi:hypothetical protein